MRKKSICIIVNEYNSVEELDNRYRELIEKAGQTVERAYSPYSNFKVGVALLLENGEIICANNQENIAFPSGLCAERIAVFYANAKYPNIAIIAIAITAYTKGQLTDMPVAPCGACRQVLLETETRYNKKIKIFLVGKSKIYVINSIKSLIPLSFDRSSISF